jgi:hypothetical protein
MEYATNMETRQSERRPCKAEITVITNDFHIARAVDISETGIRIETEKPQQVRIQLREKDKVIEYDAQLVWVKVKENGKMEYGLKYTKAAIVL